MNGADEVGQFLDADVVVRDIGARNDGDVPDDTFAHLSLEARLCSDCRCCGHALRLGGIMSSTLVGSPADPIRRYLP